MNTGARVVIIGADTARARAYAESLERASLGPVEGLFYGSPMPEREQRKNEGTTIGSLWIPRLGTSVVEIFKRNRWPFKWLATDGINSSQAVDALRDSGAELAIFAGKGGEIVSSNALAQGVPLLHMHPETMIEVVRHLRQHGQLPSAQPSAESAGRLYYVVHPLLKHLALLSLK